jgi:hypothetical protein
LEHSISFSWVCLPQTVVVAQRTSEQLQTWTMVGVAVRMSNFYFNTL